MSVLPCIGVYLLALCFRDILWIHSNNALPCGVYGHHNAISLVEIHSEKSLQNMNHKLHWRIVVVHNNHAIKRWRFNLLFKFFNSKIFLMFGITESGIVQTKVFDTASEEEISNLRNRRKCYTTLGCSLANTYIREIIASPNSEHLSNIALSINRSKS